MKIVKRHLADGTVREYRYKARTRKPRLPDGALRALFNRYSESPEFRALAPASQATYLLYMRAVESELGWMTQEDLESPLARAKFYAMRDRHSNTPAAADMRTRVLAVVLAWAYDRSEIGVNHAARMKRLAEVSPRSSTIYTEEMEARLLAELPDDMRNLYLMALYTGLRRGDLCALTPGAIRAGWLVVVPQKTARSTGAPVHLPIDEMPELARIVSRLPSDGAALLRQASGEPWDAHNLTRRWGRHMDRIGLGRMHFHDIRGTTATRLVAAGCTEAERGAIMGHAISSGSGAAYTARVRELSINAYRKWASAIERGPVVIRAGAWKTAAGK